jgi:hypothetical protein
MKRNKDREAVTGRRELLALLAGLGLAGRSTAQDPTRAEPRSYKVVLENDKVRVLDYRSTPGMGVCGKGTHFHPAHVTVSLTAGKVRVKTPDGKTKIDEAPPGTVFFAPAETHSVENIGGSNMRAYIIEIKDGDWKPSTG